MNHIYIPARSPDDWAQLLADPVKHWRTGYSARTLAFSWQSAGGFPAEVQEAFSQNEHLNDIQLLLAIPEHNSPCCWLQPIARIPGVGMKRLHKGDTDESEKKVKICS